MKRRLWWIVGAAVLVACCAALVLFGQPPEAGLRRDRDEEFRSGSGITLEPLDAAGEERLYTLAKVWGFVKYHHPDILAGDINWDAELFRVMPDVVAADSPRAVSEVLCRWLEQFPYTAATGESAARQEDTAPDFSWISDREQLGEELCRYLEGLSRLEVTDRRLGYAAFPGKSTGETVDFSAEEDLPLQDSDDGVRLLAVFRLWNAFAYYSPNLSLVDGNWDDALRQGIHTMLSAGTRRDYVLALGEMMARTGDAHVVFTEPDLYLYHYYGGYSLPCSCRILDGRAVVNGVAEGETTLCPGDVITAIDGMAVSDRIAELAAVQPVPRPGKYSQMFCLSLMSAAGTTARVTVERAGVPRTFDVQTLDRFFLPENPWKSGLMEDGAIGYIDPATLAEGDVEQLMEDFADTEGIIVDLRQYPSQPVMYLLGEYLIPEPRQFAVLTFPEPTRPGSFYPIDDFYSGAGWSKEMGLSDRDDYPLYEGKVVLLMDEFSQSQSEFTIMALRQAPRAVVVGSPSIGADGNVVEIALPGGIRTSFTGLGVYTPDGENTQRAGLEPDILCVPTPEDLRQGRDVLMETAVEQILSPQ